MAPEFYRQHYTEKADVFSLGLLFFAILERDFIKYDGKKYYGAFKRIRGIGKVGIGYAMAEYDPDITIKFSRSARGSHSVRNITLDALQFDKDDRPSAADIHRELKEIVEDVTFWFTELIASYCTIT